MGVFDDFTDELKGILKGEKGQKLKSKYVQYNHVGACNKPCQDCTDKHLRIFENNDQKPKVGEERHPHCHCTYIEVETIPLGSISKMGLLAPDVYLKAYGTLPDYYITKEEAIKIYGWNSRRNTVAGKVPGKMLGGDQYLNKHHKLPEKEARIWFEADIDYESGGRKSGRLYYSSDGEMFYSPDHGETKFYYIDSEKENDDDDE